ncbi:hypothetical protein F0562_019312 [Nyssa sinensis]|uniref:Uncharacterized protein n=1 Tax=Nyssa sinensis TaxID=561372 RepID=A0A5J4ZBN4_9ASTE|nr:hypothetical protein F0562_019312 [Nyssa sinensis]
MLPWRSPSLPSFFFIALSPPSPSLSTLCKSSSSFSHRILERETRERKCRSREPRRLRRGDFAVRGLKPTD